jgi:hypothetical protein
MACGIFFFKIEHYVTLYMSIKKRSDVKIRMKTHKLTLHCRNNDILFLRKDKNSKVLLLNTRICLDKRIAFGSSRDHVVSCYK